jgi:D-sedoheptulose 7-phosphate isomerase/D-glycero-D-manno-heptose 1,7-bisphosphate phosphatase
MKTIALTGFDGGKARELADISLHVDINEYEAAEDVHQAIMHMIAKYMRTKNSG